MVCARRCGAGGGGTRVKLADLCSCAGLGADGYASVFGAQALHGYDIEDQPHYPYGADLLAHLASLEVAA